MHKDLLEARPSLTITRTYGVAPEKVWRAWTDAEAVRYQGWSGVFAKLEQFLRPTC